MRITGSGRRRVSALVFAGVCAVAAGIGAQRGAPPLSPQVQAERAEVQKRYAYPVVRDQRGAIPPGPRPLPSPPLGDGPWLFPTMEHRDVKVSVVTKGLSHPWSLAFLGSWLITEKAGQLRVVRNGVLDPAPVAGVPKVLSRGTMAGLMDIALHPNFGRLSEIRN